MRCALGTDFFEGLGARPDRKLTSKTPWHRDGATKPDKNPLNPAANSTETLRLLQVSTFDVFHTPIERRFESITRIAKHALGVPVTAITAIVGDQQWFKSVAGWTVSQLPLRDSLCHLPTDSGHVEIISDLADDSRTRKHPFVADKPKFRFYAGCPLRDGSGTVIGTFCALDLKPHVLVADERQVFLDLAEFAQRELQSVEAGSAYSQLVAKLGAARREAMLDPLTRLWNRRGMQPLLNALLHQSDEGDFDLSVCLIDIDHFKQINDVHGHHAGDLVLRRIARHFVGALRSDDVVCRLGGDEFLAILPGVDLDQATRAAERLRLAVSDSPVSMGSTGPVRITVSVGCASRMSGASMDSHTLLRKADEALLASKEHGRNRVHTASM